MTTPTALPTTPAAVARAILSQITTDPGSLDMGLWIDLDPGERVHVTEYPACGTVMCAAGWAAYFTGWTIIRLDYPDVVQLDNDGGEAAMYAEKDGARRPIESVAAEALGLNWREVFWNADEEFAVHRLELIAEGR